MKLNGKNEKLCVYQKILNQDFTATFTANLDSAVEDAKSAVQTDRQENTKLSYATTTESVPLPNRNWNKRHGVSAPFNHGESP